MASFAEYTKKKKKEKENLSAAGKSFSEYTREKLGIELDDIAPVSVTTIAPTVTTSKKSSYFDDGYDFGDITKTILGLATSAGKTINTVASSPKKNEEATKSTFDKVLEKQYSSMSLTELEKEKSRIEKEEKEHKEKNGGKLTNYLSKAGSYIAEGMSGQSGSSVRTKAQSNIDKIDDLTRQKEILNVYRKQKATEEYLGGLDDKQLKMLDNIAEAKDLENAAPFSILAPQGGMDATTYSKITEVERTAGKEAREQLYNQLKKKNPKKSDEELNELIDNMVELRRNQVNAKENSSMMLDIKGNGAASAFDPTLENKVGFATEHPVASFLLSRGLNVLGGPMGLFEMYMQRGNEYGLDTNAPGFSFTNAASTIDEKIQLDHDWKIGGVDAFDLFYKAGTGIVDNVARLAMSGGNTTLAGAMMFTQGTTQSIIAGKEKGYSDAKALTMGLLDGTFEAISEKISLDSILGNKGGALRTLAKSFAAEGSEELTSNWLNRIADQIANGKHSDLSKQYEAYINEGYTKSQALAEVVGSVIGEDFESFLIGGIAGAVMGSGVAVSNVQQNKTNQLSEDNLSKEAKTVFDKVVEARIAEATEDGKTLTEMEEAKIRQAVLKEISNGDIETEEIESILSPEDYAKYKKVADTSSAYESKLNEGIEKMQQRHDELQKEYDELNELDLMTAKLGDHNRQNDIKKEMASLEEKIQQWNTELDEYKNDKTRSELETNLKTKLEQNVFELVKDTELGESYRRKQAFEADFEKFKGTKHEDAARKTLENAEKSGLRNSKGIRTLVEASARFSGNTGVVFEYKTGEQAKNDFIERQTAEISKIESIPEAQRTKKQIKDLANMKKTLEDVKSGKLKVDGNVTGNTITINLDSPKALNIVTGHEITHLFEKAKSYKKLKDAVIEYAKMKGIDTESELEIREAKYSGAKDSNPEAELVADLVGDFLHTDYDFVLHLANKKTDLFHHLWDEVKYLCKMATAGSKEARQLEKVKRNFERAYREASKNSDAKVEGAKNSLSDNNITVESTGYASGESYYTMSYKKDGKVVGTVEYGEYEGQPNVKMIEVDPEYRRQGIGTKLLQELQKKYPDEEIAFGMSTPDGTKLLESVTYDVTDEAVVSDREKLKALQTELNDLQEKLDVLYDVENPTEAQRTEVDKLGNRWNEVYDSIRELEQSLRGKRATKTFVKTDTKYSLSETDNEYLSAVESGDTETAQKMVDEVAKKNGYTLKAYHGTPNNEFTVFDKGRVGKGIDQYGAGFYFATNREAARGYGSRVIDSILAINNPLKIDASTENGANLIDGGFDHMLTKKQAYEVIKRLPNIYDSEESILGDYYESYWETGTQEWMIRDLASNESYRNIGYLDSDLFRDYPNELHEALRDVVGYDGVEVSFDNGEKFYVAWFDNQMKSSEPITYDDNGNVIPLSERFKAENNDIRYSLSTDDYGHKLTESQREYFKDAKTIDHEGRLRVLFHGSRNPLFTEFNTEQGVWLTPDQRYAEVYADMWHSWRDDFADAPLDERHLTGLEKDVYSDQDYRLYEMYANIVNPLDLGEIDEELTNKEISKLARMVSASKYDIQNIIDAYDCGMVFDVTRTEEFIEMARKKGYDGFSATESGRLTFCAFDAPNQVKLTSNKNPSADADVRYSFSSVANTFFDDPNMSAEEFENADYTETQGYKDYVEKCVNNYRQTRVDFNEKVARKSIKDSIDGIVRVAIAAKKAGYDIYDDNHKRNVTDSKKRLLFSSLEPNSDYLTSNDISTECDKRKNFADIYDAIVKREEAMGVPHGKRFFDNVDNYFYIHKVLADKGLTQPCRQCYVESMRKNLAPMARKFLQLITETNVNNKANDQLYQTSGKNKGQLKSNNAKLRERVLETLSEYEMTVDDLNIEKLSTAEGLAELKITAPYIYEAFNSFYGQSKPKMPKSATPFRFGELTALLTDSNGKINQTLVDKINATGGFRLQSYSDFQIQNYVDVLQVLFEAGTLGLSGHAYTKVPAFLQATEGTNLKRNISIFMYKDGTEWKLDKNDSFPYELEDIYDIVDADKSGNTSIIAVSQNDDMSAWIMANDNIGYGIPFHKSGLKMGTVRETDVKTDDGRIIKGYSGIKDHTKQQTEVWAKTTADHKAFTKVKKGINIYSKEVGWDFENKKNLSKIELIEKNLRAYINACERAGYLPKFRAYVMNNDGILNKTLQYAKELGFVSQDATIEDISFKYKGYTIPYGYYKFLGDFGMFTPDGKASPHKTLSLDNYSFDNAVKFFEDSETLRRNEILQQFANGEERAKYRDSNLNAGELADIVRQKRDEVVDSIVAPTKNSLSEEGDRSFAPADSWLVYGDRVESQNDIAPVKKTVSKTEKVAPTVARESVASAPTSVAEPLEETPIRTTKQKLSAKLQQSHEELEKNIQLREKSNAYYDEKIAKAQAEYDAKKNKDTKAANSLLRSIERYKRLKGSADADYKKRIYDIESRITKLDDQLLSNHDKADRLEKYKKRADARLEADKKLLKEEFDHKKATLQEEIADKPTFVRNKALQLYNELNGLKKGVKASEELGHLLDYKFKWSELKSTLLKVSKWSDTVINPESEIESIVREAIGRDYEDKHDYGMQDLEAEYLYQVEQLETEAQKKLEEFKVANQRMTKQNEYTTLMEELIGDTSTWKDKKLGISYEVNTLRRNLRDIVRDANGNKDIAKADAITDELQGKYNHNEAELNRESNRIKQHFADMKITKAEDTYIQMLGEFRHNPETTLTEEVVKEYYEKHKKHIDEAKVDKAIEESRKLYDDLLVRVNQVLSEQGMKEIPYRKGYFPHFTEDKQSFLGKLFNWKTQNNEIPTDIAGITETFEPNRSWQSFNKQRKTDETDYSFTKGLDSYVQGSLDWIYHIEDIQKRRALENHIRYTHSEDGVKAKVDAILDSEVYDADQMQEQIDLVYREARNPLNNFIQDFHTATNTLAGKKSTFDRDLEQRTNRKIYSVMTNLSNRVSGNMVAGSVSSALTNFIPITQSWVEVSPVTSLRAMGETIASTIRDDGTVDKSDFLTNRLKKAENLYQTFWDKAGKGVGFLMDVIDGFTSQTVWRSKYIQNMSRGMSETEAIKNADQFAANVMADRSRGNQPTLFDSKSPVAKIFTAFQLEVNNQYGYFFKDAPQDIADKSKARLVAGYATAFFGAYAYNALYSAMTGRDAAFDPIGIIEDLLRDLGFGGDDDEEEEIAPVDVALNLTNNILEEVPFIGGLLGGGRIPISSAMPYGGIMEAFEGTLKDISEGNVKTLTKEWLNPVYYLAMPMGGGQFRKTNQGLGMFSDDHPVAGSYTDSGNLRFPVEKTPLNVLQAGVFGQYANKNARTYFDEDYAPLKEKQIKEYAESEMPIADYWKYREGLKEFTKQDEKAAYINGLDISKKQKDVLKSYLYDEEGYKKENPEKYAFLEREGIGYLGYKELDEDTQSAWSWAFKHQDEYEHFKENGVLPGDYSTYYIPMLEFEDEGDKAYQWSFDNPEKATLGRVFGNGVKEYRQYAADLDEIKADKDAHGKTINGSAKEKKKAYIWSLPIDYGQKVILYRSLYDSKDDKATYNQDIIDYLISREDITYDEMNTICEELGFEVNRDTGMISW